MPPASIPIRRFKSICSEPVRRISPVILISGHHPRNRAVSPHLLFHDICRVCSVTAISNCRSGTTADHATLSRRPPTRVLPDETKGESCSSIIDSTSTQGLSGCFCRTCELEFPLGGDAPDAIVLVV